MSKPLRKCVVGVFVKKSDPFASPLVMVGERFNVKNAWQFPQGGVLKGEPLNIAIMREMYEELGTDKVNIIMQSPITTDYYFPVTLNQGIGKKYGGQSLHWFLLEFLNNSEPNLALAQDQEFSQFKWVSPETAIDLAIEWKKQAYSTGLKSLGVIKD